MEGVACRCDRPCRSVFPVHNGAFYCRKGGCTDLSVCTGILPAHSCDRLFLAEGGWGEDVLYPVLRLRACVYAVYVCDGDAGDRGDDCWVDAASLRRSAVLRCRIYTADHRTEECESCGGVADLKPGILFLRACGMGCSWRKALGEGVCRLRVDVCCDHTGSVAGERKINLANRKCVVYNFNE